MDADIFISLTHFKGHESTGFGGTLKNIGMGCGSRAGKMEMHNAGKPHVAQETCVGCHACERNCAHGAISFQEKKASIDHNRCVGCGRCVGVCPVDAVETDVYKRQLLTVLLNKIISQPIKRLDVYKRQGNRNFSKITETFLRQIKILFPLLRLWGVGKFPCSV